MTAAAQILRVADRASYWSEGTRSEIVVAAAMTGGRYSVLEEWLPPGAGPPLHSHPEEESFLIVEGHLTLWNLPHDDAQIEEIEWTHALLSAGISTAPGSLVTVPGRNAHCYRVEGSAPAHVIVMSRPSGLEAWTREFGVPTTALGLPPHDLVQPEVSRERMRAFSRSVGVRRHGHAAPVASIVRPTGQAEHAAVLQLVAHAAYERDARESRGYLVLAGQATVQVASETHELSPGDVALLAEGHSFSLRTETGATLLPLD